ncbi:MAG: T9SS type A sorting domain-containing protein [Melioribacteraceae bacterium]|nr:T9SS type A sorting domain-containing protein [Melioribacteraceae bacterium]MCF8264148.1 T9SS type A sorting domain-containing protein [Melioribacteraceae bacterium]
MKIDKIFRNNFVFLFVPIFVLFGNDLKTFAQDRNEFLVDKLATTETVNLFRNLKTRTHSTTLFGHQDATAYGVGWKNIPGKSDVKDVCGDHPAVFGWDLGDIGQFTNLDGVSFNLIKKSIIEAYNRGGINTISLHLDNPVTGGNAWDNSTAVKNILPGGSHHSSYLATLGKVADFLKELKTTDGVFIPIVLRPYHEHNQSWSWWGVSACSEAEYTALWKMTVNFFRDTEQIHNLLYAISPQDINTTQEYFKRYPGDNYVDVLGLDFYNLWDQSWIGYLSDALSMLAGESEKRGKVFAITETGVEGIPINNWWTDYLLKSINANGLSRQVSWVLVWRNASSTHHFAPYPGHSSVQNFIEFYNDSTTSFESDLNNFYDWTQLEFTPPILTKALDDSLISYSTKLEIIVESDESAYLRYAFENIPFAEMPYSFETGQGGTIHRTEISGEHNTVSDVFVKAIDINGNESQESVSFTIIFDTSKTAINWKEFLYDDTDWKTGTAPIGFGDSQNVSNSSNVTTTYFRRTVTLPDSLNGLGLLLKGHDGIAAYFNSEELIRLNLRETKLYSNTFAENSTTLSRIYIFTPEQLSQIENEITVSVEVHKIDSPNADISFDARLFNNDGIYLDLGSTWKYYDNGSEPENQIIDKVTSIATNLKSKLNDFVLAQNFPNPFNPSTSIVFEVPHSGQVSIIVYDILGSEIRPLFNGIKSAGKHTVIFNGENLNSGIYFYRITAGNFIQTKSMLLLK